MTARRTTHGSRDMFRRIWAGSGRQVGISPPIGRIGGEVGARPIPARSKRPIGGRHRTRPQQDRGLLAIEPQRPPAKDDDGHHDVGARGMNFGKRYGGSGAALPSATSGRADGVDNVRRAFQQSRWSSCAGLVSSAWELARQLRASTAICSLARLPWHYST